MAKHALPPETQRQARRARLRRSLPTAIPIVLAGGFLESADVPAYVHPLLFAFGAVLPLSLVDGLAKSLTRVLAERRARRGSSPRPRITYLVMALAWLAAGTAFALLAWAAGAVSTGPGKGADATATGLVWATMISICATLMMALRAATAGAAGRPSWFARLRAARPARTTADSRWP
jgi:hypothetical protein